MVTSSPSSWRSPDGPLTVSVGLVSGHRDAGRGQDLVGAREERAQRGSGCRLRVDCTPLESTDTL